MPTFQLPPTDGLRTLDDVINYVAKVAKELSWTMNNLDRKNINHLIFNFGNGAYIKIDKDGIEFFDGTKVTLKSGLDGLLKLTGAIFQTRDGSYPRVEINGPTNLLEILYNATNKIRVNPGQGSSPAIIFQDGSYNTFMIQSTDLFSIVSSSIISLSGSIVALNNVKVDGGDELGSIPLNLSTATTIEQLVNDHNDLLLTLKAMKIIG